MARVTQASPHRALPSSYEPEWQVAGRVTCDNCANRSRSMCAALKISCHPLHLTHDCERFARRIGK